MKLLRWVAAVPLAAAIGLVPVLSPVWAAPRPVPAAVHTVPISGVDGSALRTSPPAFDAQSLDARGVGAPARASAAKPPAAYTAQLSTGRFTAAGVTWSATAAPAKVIVQVRIRENGVWLDWQQVDAAQDADPGSADMKKANARRSTEPITSANADAIQVRVDTATTKAPAQLNLVTVDPGNSPADSNVAGTPAASAQAGTRAPAIITRAQWGADESMRTCSPSYSSTIKAGFVHHTVNSNNYSAADVPALIRGIYAFHVNGNGWCDVGYQFIVDKFGRIFEGRAGGVDKPVIGAQAGGFNTYTFGVSGLGDFSTAQPTSAMVSGITQVLGWKLGLHNRNPRSSTVLISAGGPNTGYPAGQAVAVNVVSGHRDVDLTGCPMNLYNYLPGMRINAALYVLQNGTVDQDLYGALSPGAGSAAQVHAQSAASGYSARMLSVATSWTLRSPGQWRFFIGSSQGDTRPDLIGVQTTGTGSGRVEVHVATWASNYQDTLINTVTPMGTFTPDTDWQVTTGGPSGGDLYFIGLRGTGSGKVEVHSLSAASSYTAFSIHAASSLASGAYPSASNRFLVSKYSGNLYLVAHGATGSGRTEVHSLSAASGFRSFFVHAATPLGPTDDASTVWALTATATPDLNFLPVSSSGSRNVEMHRLSAASGYAAWSLHAATNLPLLGYPTWQFGMG